MPREEQRSYSVLIVSGSKTFDAAVRNSLPRKQFPVLDFCGSASAARRSVFEKDYDILAVCCPLADEFGHELALDAAMHTAASVLLAVPAEVYADVLEHVTDQGVLVLERSAVRERIGTAVRFLAAVQNRRHQMEREIRRASEKLEDVRIISRAKIMLMTKQSMTEDEAHRYIGRLAMNQGVTRRRIAEQLLE